MNRKTLEEQTALFLRYDGAIPYCRKNKDNKAALFRCQKDYHHLVKIKRKLCQTARDLNALNALSILRTQTCLQHLQVE